ncbi:unnamed protein product [Rotaria sp. Silwood1]|nr:unnamed protein product [Rotaria sp. Silwood1]CAF3378953.1 unnamed protein product [Rotaria sp. Silwood1]CAF4486419.1 unnamed protein product [Rotaria sp. Silwood1]CAF4515000.1 unnamed protein product [Rotaria sp. Silwood1]
MGTPPLRLSSVPWSLGSFHVPPSHRGQFLSSYPTPRPLQPFVLTQQQNPYASMLSTLPSYSNRRYQDLKKSTSYPNRRPSYRSLDTSKRSHHDYGYNESIHSHQSRPSKTKSVSDFGQMSQFTSTHLPKAHSWHTMMNHRQSNLSVAYAKEMNLTPKRRRKHSPKKYKKIRSQRRLSSSPKRNPSFIKHRKRPIQIPEYGIVRISTLDEMPINNNQTNKRNNSINNDRLSTKGSLSNLSKRRKISKEKPKENNSIKNRKIKKNEKPRMNLDTESSSSSSSSSSLSSSSNSYSSLQQRLNGSLRNDPLIIDAMEDFRQLRRLSSQNTSISPHNRSLSRDSLCSDSTLHSSTISRSHSQSSFTSVERLEIRELIKTVKTQGKTSLNASHESISIAVCVSSSEQSIITDIQQPSTPKNKPKKSCVTEELDRKFSKLRSLEPDQELTYVTPSSICKRKKTLEKPAENIPPVPTFDELLRQVQLRPVNKLIKPISTLKEKSINDNYENPLTCIPVPRCSPIPIPEIKTEETKHDYAIPIKKTEEKPLSQLDSAVSIKETEEKPPSQLCHFQPMRTFTLNKARINRVTNKRSKFNWFQYGLTNQMPTTFQPNFVSNNQNEHETSAVQENIYTSDIDAYIPSSITDKTDKTDDNTLQTHLDNQTILTDDFYSDFGTKQITVSSSLIDDFSNLFTRKHKHEIKLHKKNQRCSIM